MACQPSRLLALLLIAQVSRRYAFMAPGLAKACLPGPGSGTGMVLRVRVWQRHDALGPGQARMAVSEPGACTGMCPLRQGTAINNSLCGGANIHRYSSINVRTTSGHLKNKRVQPKFPAPMKPERSKTLPKTTSTQNLPVSWGGVGAGQVDFFYLRS